MGSDACLRVSHTLSLPHPSPVTALRLHPLSTFCHFFSHNKLSMSLIPLYPHARSQQLINICQLNTWMSFQLEILEYPTGIFINFESCKSSENHYRNNLLFLLTYLHLFINLTNFINHQRLLEQAYPSDPKCILFLICLLKIFCSKWNP